MKNKTQLAALFQKGMIQRQHQHRHHATKADNICAGKQGLQKQDQPGFALLCGCEQMTEASVSSEYDLPGVQSRQRYVDK